MHDITCMLWSRPFLIHVFISFKLCALETTCKLIVIRNSHQVDRTSIPRKSISDPLSVNQFATVFFTLIRIFLMPLLNVFQFCTSIKLGFFDDFCPQNVKVISLTGIFCYFKITSIVLSIIENLWLLIGCIKARREILYFRINSWVLKLDEHNSYLRI